MKRFAVRAILFGALASISGCASIHSTRAIATPWGVGGVHSFRPAEPIPAPKARIAEAQVAKLLDEQAGDDLMPTRVAAR
jgi:hypothetical protein